MAEYQTLAAADLIPDDVIPVRGYTVTGYPYAGPMGLTALPVETRKGIPMILYVESETPYEVIR